MNINLPHKTTLTLLLLLTILLIPNSHAANTKWQLSDITFHVKHMEETIIGSFEKYKDTISFDPNNLENTKVSIILDLLNITTNNSTRDSILTSEEFLNAKKFPQATFLSQKVLQISQHEYSMEGLLNLKGIKKTVSLNFQQKNDNLIIGVVNIDRRLFNIATSKQYDDTLEYNILVQFRITPLY